jgi:hypothetical protein
MTKSKLDEVLKHWYNELYASYGLQSSEGEREFIKKRIQAIKQEIKATKQRGARS